MKTFFIIVVLVTVLTLAECRKYSTAALSRTANGRIYTLWPQEIIKATTPPPQGPTFPPPTCTCADHHDFEIEECALDSLKTRLAQTFWYKLSNAWTNDELDMKNILLKMLKSDTSIWRNKAFLNTAFLINYLPHIHKKPNLCAFAQMINATIAWEKHKDSEAIAEALDHITTTLMEYIIATGNNAIKNAGCTAPKTKFRNENCYKNGTIYLFRDMWKIDGGIMPCAYKKTAKILYKSDSYTSQLLAITATLSQSPPFQDFARNFNPHLLYKFLHITNTSPIPPCCCSAFIKKITKSYPAFKYEIESLTEEIKTKYSKNWD